MKQNAKHFAAGLLAGVMVASLPALADSIWEKIDVQRNQITVEVNGKKVDADNFLYNDTTYLPIRKVAQMLGFMVTYDEETNRALIVDSLEAVLGGEVIGKVGAYNITEDMLSAYVNQIRMTEDTTSLSEEDILAKAKDLLRYNMTIKAEAIRNGGRIDEAFENDYNNRLYFTSLQYGGKANLYKTLEAMGYSPESFRHFQEIERYRTLLIEALALKVDNVDLNAYYDAHKEDYRYDAVRVKHILIPATEDMSAADQKKAKSQADSVYNLAKKKDADFDALIKEYGEDPGMTLNPTGYVLNASSNYVQEFKDASLALKEGEISKPIKSEYGYHIIKCEEVVPYRTLDDSSVSDGIKKTLATERATKLINEKLSDTQDEWY